MIANTLNEVILSTPAPSNVVEALVSGTVVADAGNIAEILSKYGPFIGILSIFLAIFIVIIGLIIWNNKKMIERILEKDSSMEDLSQDLLNNIATAVIANLNNNVAQPAPPVVQQVDSTHISSENKKDLVEMYIDVNIAFKDASRIAINKLKCERVAIYVFHNGNKSIHGLPFFKMSCVHEWTMKGSYTIRGKSHIDLPLHAFSSMIECLYCEGECAISDIASKQIIDDHTVQFCEYSNVKSMFLLGIRDKDDHLAGFTIAEYKTHLDFAEPETYNFVKDVMSQMIDNIRSIIIDVSFQKNINNDNS